MTGILSGDVKTLKSKVMDDVPEGGGPPTGSVVLDGTSNGIFNDISELDRAGGRVNLRKLFVGIQTPNVDGYFGANVIVSDPYDDPRVSTTLFPALQFFDTRTEAANRMESYLAKGPVYQGYLFGDHIAGQASVTLLQREEATVPVVGQTLVLIKNEGLSTQFVQFIRIVDVSSSLRTFSDEQGDFKRIQVNLEISDVLQEDFNGFEAIRKDSSISYVNKTKTCETIIADAARYYGTVKLKDEATLGDFTVKGEGIYTQLVPSTRIEVPIADARMNQQSATLVAAGENYSRSLFLSFTTTQSMFIGGGILPGSFSIVRGGITLTDKGGVLIDQSSAQVGTLDYENGIAALSTNVWGTGPGTHDVAYTPAYAPTLVSESLPQEVTAINQRLSWALTLDPPPTKGSLIVSYRALGRWYELRDDGSGALRGGDSSYGAGSLNPSTGTATVTLGALPDVDSAIVYTYVPSVVTRRLSDLPVLASSLPRALGSIVALGRAIKPGTLSFTWNDGTARTSTDTNGLLGGDATGAVIYGEGRINFRPNVLPAKGTTINVSITETVQHKESVSNFTDASANWTCTLPAPVKAKTLEVAVRGYDSEASIGLYGGGGTSVYRSYRLFDDGAGALLYNNGSTNVPIGTINYTTGVVVVPKNWASILQETRQYAKALLDGTAESFKLIGSTTNYRSLEIQNGGGATAFEPASWGWWSGAQVNALEARYSGNDASGYSTAFALDEIFLPANPAAFSDYNGYAAKLSSFFIGPSLYSYNQSASVWVRDPSPTTGLGTDAGANAVLDGIAGVLLATWPAGVSSAPTGIAGATQPAVTGIASMLSVERVVFRTAISPLLNGGFNIAGTWTSSGATFSVSADNDGLINTGSAPVGATPGSVGVFGFVDYEMGLVTVAFGRRVPSSMNGDSDVIDISDIGIPGVDKIQVATVQSDTLRYNATGYSYLPLDPEILGLNPVRLPPDGRVPIFRKGAFVVIGNTQKLTATYTNGQSINCGRVRLARVRVIGNDGLLINTGYTANLDTGIVSIVDVTSWSQPATIEHRIEDMMLVSDVQLNGQLSFTRPVTHDYPVLGTYISSAMIAGDIRARTSLVFDQFSWDNVWNDSVSASGPAVGTYNDTTNPITVTNDGALTERWAVVFQNTTSYQVIGEHIGVIGVGTTGVDCSPINPNTSTPYFTIPHAGWGLGWSTGNVLRFNTVGAMFPVWIARTILQGPETVENDSFTLLARGDVDRP